MKSAIKVALVIAFFVVLPLRSPAQEVTSGVSPDVHAAFEYQYALVATSMSVSQDHREAVAAILQSFENGTVSEVDATKRINDVLSPAERRAVSDIERSFFGRRCSRSMRTQARTIP